MLNLEELANKIKMMERDFPIDSEVTLAISYKKIERGTTGKISGWYKIQPLSVSMSFPNLDGYTKVPLTALET